MRAHEKAAVGARSDCHLKRRLAQSVAHEHIDLGRHEELLQHLELPCGVPTSRSRARHARPCGIRGVVQGSRGPVWIVTAARTCPKLHARCRAVPRSRPVRFTSALNWSSIRVVCTKLRCTAYISGVSPV
eukprot:5927939-Prymnesium_polylepis.1